MSLEGIGADNLDAGSRGAALPTSRFVIRREQFARAMAARDTLAEARAEARLIVARGVAEAEAERRRGFDEGLRAGQTEAARLLAGAAGNADAFLEQREAELAELVFAVAAKLIGTVPERELAVRLVSAAITDYRADTVLTLRTDLAGVAAVRQTVAELGVAARVHVESHAELAPGQCVLVHAGGQASVGLLDQFRAMMAQAARVKVE